MNEEQITLAIIRQLNHVFPAQKAAINFLMELLSITYEAAYRRMKAKIPFRLSEAVLIARYFNCSIDSLLEIQSFQTELMKEGDPIRQYTAMLRNDVEVFKRISASGNAEINVTANRIPFKYFDYPNLFRLEYFSWLHRHRLVFRDQSFSDVVIPDEILSLHEECAFLVKHLNHAVKICLNDQCFESVVQHITYYLQMHKISDRDLRTLLDELASICDQLQLHFYERDKKLLFSGIFYYSQLPIAINSVSVKYDDGFFVSFWLSDSVSVVYQNDANVFNMNRNWFNSQIFVSQLVSGANALMQDRLLSDIQAHLKKLHDLV